MDLSQTAQNCVNVAFLWIGFGVAVGLTARALLPGEEPKGTLGTVLVGVGGSSVGLLLLSVFWRSQPLNPISPMGFFVSLLAAIGILLVFRFSLTLWKRRPKTKMGNSIDKEQ